jgi:hypothetical protein
VTPSASKQRPRRRCKAMKNQEAVCEHYEQPIWMTALGGRYQARCMGCQTVGPVVIEGPWAAEQALYSSGRVRTG